ncbi:hypothetical protein WDV76_11085 [Xenorhabdus griffiniae]|uniref:hypothetical protein n=1 Tax=Xenorhabdus griffiniae TaxID=351672 RepID=UPI0030D41126
MSALNTSPYFQEEYIMSYHATIECTTVVLGGIAPIASDNDLNAKRLPTSFYRMGGGTGGRDGEQVFCCGMIKILYFIFG